MMLQVDTSAGSVCVNITKEKDAAPPELKLWARCNLVGDTTADPMPRPQTIHVLPGASITSLTEKKWTNWREMEGSATNAPIPDGLVAGGTVTVPAAAYNDGADAVWTAGVGAPTADPVIGQWYADLGSRDVYKGVRGDILKFAQLAADEFVARRGLPQLIDSLDIPDEPDDTTASTPVAAEPPTT